MWWKLLVGLAFGLFAGTLAITPLFFPARQKSADFSLSSADYSSQRFSRLSAQEINRRTLKAAAAIEGFHRSY